MLAQCQEEVVSNYQPHKLLLRHQNQKAKAPKGYYYSIMTATSCKRQLTEAAALEDEKEKNRLMAAELQNALDAIEGLNTTVTLQTDELIWFRLVVLDEKEDAKTLKLSKTIEMWEEKGVVLSYDDLKPGGILEKYINDFTYFPSHKANDFFLDPINFTEKCKPGNGLYESMVHYSTIYQWRREKSIMMIYVPCLITMMLWILMELMMLVL